MEFCLNPQLIPILANPISFEYQLPLDSGPTIEEQSLRTLAIESCPRPVGGWPVKGNSDFTDRVRTGGSKRQRGQADAASQ